MPGACCHNYDPGKCASEADANGESFAAYEDLLRERYGAGWIEWYERQQRTDRHGDGFTGWIEPRVMFAKR
jgi:hypothetical protein